MTGWAGNDGDVYGLSHDSGNFVNESGELNVENLERQCEIVLNMSDPEDDSDVELNKNLAEYALINAVVLPDGRIQMPLLWNKSISHNLGRNYKLVKQILISNYKKLAKNEHLTLTDEVFKEQEKMGIIERTEDVDKYLKQNPDYSFLPHMSVIKPAKETTKCSVVNLSNLCENATNGRPLSHNQTIYSGPNLNKKIIYFTTSSKI